MSEALESKETERCGKGTFAVAPIKKDQLLLVFGGHVLTREEECRLPEKIQDIAIQIEKNLVLGVCTEDELGNSDYVNHCCEPNTGIKGQISLVALRNIEVGEEITFDYGTVIYQNEGAPYYELKCECGAKNCRKKITQHDWKLPALQEKYKGYFPYYIQEAINETRK